MSARPPSATPSENGTFTQASRATGLFPTVEALAAEIEAFWQQHAMSVEQQGAQYVLRMEGHRDIPWHQPERAKAWRRKPNRVFYEETQTALFTFLLSRFEISKFLDIGAGIGYFCEVAASFKAAPPDSFAFDMLPARREHLQKLETSQRYQGAIQVFFAGLSDQHFGDKPIWYSVTKMYEEEPPADYYRDSFWRRLKFRLRGRTDRDKLVEHICQITSIDHFCQERDLKPDLLKIDVDGYEAKVIPGGLETFRSHRPLIALEIHNSRFLRPFHVNRREVVAPLFDLGYRCLLITDHLDRRAARCIPIDQNDPVIMRDETDLLLFV